MTHSPDPPATPIRHWSRSLRAALVAVVVVALALRIVAHPGIGFLDELNYAINSLEILEHGPGTGIGFHQMNRLGMTLPPAASMAVFGRSEPAYLLWFACISAAEILAIPVLLTRILRPQEVILAAALHLLAPQTIRLAMIPSADAAMASLVGLSILVAYTARPGAPFRQFALSGLLFGIAMLHKETAIVAAPVAGFAVLAAAGPGRRIRAALAFAAGAAALLTAEMVAFATWTGHPLYRYTSLQRTHSEGGLPAWDAATKWRVILKMWPGNLLGFPQSLGVLVFVLPAVLGIVVLRPAADRTARFAAVWFLFLATYTIFGSSSPTKWTPLLPYPRYLQFALLPGAIVAARVLAGVDLRLTSPAARALAAVPAAALAAIACNMNRADSETLVFATTGAFLAVWCAARPGAAILPALAVVLAACSLGLPHFLGRGARQGDAERAVVSWAAASGVDVIESVRPWTERLRLAAAVEVGVPVQVRRLDEFADLRGKTVVMRDGDLRGLMSPPHSMEVVRTFPDSGPPAYRVLRTE